MSKSKTVQNAARLGRNRSAPWWGLAALIGWACVLATVGNMHSGSLILMLAYASLVFVLTMALRPCEWRLALLLFGGGTLWFSLAILSVQQFPQAAGTNPDAALYELQARALDLHWQGKVVPTQPFGVLPFENQDGSRVFEFWRPTDSWGLGAVMGSSHFAYQVFVAAFYFLADVPPQVVVLGQAVLLGGLPLLAFGIAERLFNGHGVVPLLTAALVMADLNYSVSAAWLLKDTLVTWITALAVLGTIDLLSGRGRPWAMAVLIGSLIVLAISRAHVFYVLMFLIFSWTILRWFRSGKHETLSVLVIVVAWVGAGIVLIPDFSKPASNLAMQAVTAPLSTLRGFQQVISASFQAALVLPTVTADGEKAFPEQQCISEGAVDGVVCDFQASARKAPFWTFTRGLARTLFAPYPWVAISPGLGWQSFTELYYPGTILWISLLPFLGLGVVRAPRRRETVLVLALAAMICLIYITVLGEFSTRQRQFLMPILVPFSAWGLVHAHHLWQRRRRGWRQVGFEE